MRLPVLYRSLSQTEKKAVREAYTASQGGLCYFCHALLTEPPQESVQNTPVMKKLFPTGFFSYPVHLHHSHVTGLTLGAVHCKCNAVLHQYYGE